MEDKITLEKKNAKKTTSMFLDEEIIKRLKEVATFYNRTPSNIIEICLKRYLPAIEKMIKEKEPTELEHHKGDESSGFANYTNIKTKKEEDKE